MKPKSVLQRFMLENYGGEGRAMQELGFGERDAPAIR